MNVLKELFGTPSNIINTLSFFISVATFIVALNFKKRVQKEFDRKSLEVKAERLSKELNGDISSLTNDQKYDIQFLQAIVLRLDGIITDFTCLSRRLKFRILYSVYFINKHCIDSDSPPDKQHVFKLCKQLQKIAILIKKEV